MKKLSDKICLVTGAARGIGESIAQAFHAEGATVIVTDKDSVLGQKVAKSINSEFFKLDVSSEEDWHMLAKHTPELDVLVNNAGITGFEGPFEGPPPAQDPENASLKSWRDVHAVNLDGTFLGCRYAIQAMRNNGSAEIVSIATNPAVDIGAIIPNDSEVSTYGLENVGLLGKGLWSAVFGAFLGGLILNLMPCVFPIISLKALSLAKTAHGERRDIRRAGWAYTAGALLSFAVFALLLIGLKAAGASVGWGFQLQSPWLVGVLALLLFAIGLNLLGVFEIGGRFQNIGSGVVKGGGRLSSFLTGVLAVIVATPCTAPFMAGAVGYALTSSAAVSMAVFLTLGLGFALPFLLLAYAPGLLARLPKPGPWMETFRQVLAFPMFAAAIWLVWVLSLQSGADGVAKLLLGALLLAFALWLFRKGSGLAKILGVVALLASIALPLSTKAPDSTTGETAINAGVWSAEAVAMAQSEERPIFVDFTAAWCVTCKVNERLVLKTKKAADLFERTDTKFLIADWTNKDDGIAAELARFGRAGVPLYLVYTPGSDTPKILPQMLSYDILKEALE